ncbi:hypothetical protein F5884DRAFT_853411 [Xylogone sp. PMI_703]|nr:hypothetical protein F5884DRAFT_853411 [Xylogone sp. PMI_703]
MSAGAIIAQAAPIHKATQACMSCKSRKQKCDKHLPSCSRCLMLHYTCQYGVDPGTLTALLVSRISGAQGGSSRDLLRSTHDPAPFILDLPLDLQLSLIFSVTMIGRSNLTSTPCRDRQNESGAREFLKHICKIFSTVGVTVPEVVTTYFTTVHQWLPMISRIRFYRSLNQLQSQSPADLSLLILCMYLITRLPAPQIRTHDMQNSLYLTTKRLFLLFQSWPIPSLRLIQAGVLVSAYEIGHDMIDAAFLTIGMCIRMGQVLGIDNYPENAANSVDDAFCAKKEEVCTWWATILVDRLANLEKPYIHERRYSVGVGIPDPVYLVVDDDTYRISAVEEQDLTDTIFSRGRQGNYCRTAQAAHILGVVLEHISNPDRDCNAELVDSNLQSLIFSFMKEAGHDAEICCEAISMSFSSLFLLHGWVLGCSISKNPSSLVRTGDDKSLSKATLALQTATRMVLDNCKYSNKAFIKRVGEFSLMGLHCTYIACMAYVHLHDYVGRDDGWIDGLNIMRDWIKRSGQRWTISGKSLY